MTDRPRSSARHRLLRRVGRRPAASIAAAVASMLTIGVCACGTVADSQSIVEVSTPHPSSDSTGSTAPAGSPAAVRAPDVLPAAAAATSDTTTSEPPTPESTQKMIDGWVKQMGVVGLAAAVVQPGADGITPQVTYYTSGSPVLGGPDAVTPTTQFEVGSVSKAFTADLLATLVAAGKVSLDDPLQKYAPAGITVPTFTTSSGDVVPITLGDLATHQSGLPYPPPNEWAGCPGNPGFCVNGRALYTRDIMWQQLSQTTLLWAPGTNWMYSNFAFGILGTVLADLVQPGETTPPYNDALQAQVLSNFSLPATSLEVAGNQIATGYTSFGTDVTPQPEYLDTNAMAGEGGMVSDATDMATWMAAHLGYPVGSSPDADQPLVQTLQLVSTATTTCDQENPGNCSANPQAMGLAWQLYPANNQILQPYAFKNGETSGFQTEVFLAPSAKVGVAVMTNTVIEKNPQWLASKLLAEALPTN